MKKIVTLVLFISCFAYAVCQNKQDYFISDIPKTIITNKPTFLNVTDTINKGRRFRPVSDLLGGLSPVYPMAESVENDIHIYSNISIDFLRFLCTLGCQFVNLLVEVNDTIIEISSKEKFREIFAPVESKEEALSFAYALSGVFYAKAIYDFSFLKEKGTDYEVFRKEIKPTSVRELTDGYEVILFSTYYGHTAYCSELLLFVSKEGNVKILKRERLFHDKKFDIIIN